MTAEVGTSLQLGVADLSLNNRSTSKKLSQS
jgi:hypothetical protein